LALVQFKDVIEAGGSVMVPEYDWVCVCWGELLSVTFTE
jgi:hypothetical protein